MVKKSRKSQYETEKNVKCVYGTIDSHNFVSAYLTFNTWIEPLNNDHESSLKRFRRTLLDEFYNSLQKTSLFDKKNYIFDFKTKENRLQLNNKTFTSLQINIYANKNINVEWDSNTKKEITYICECMCNLFLDNNKLILTKTGK